MNYRTLILFGGNFKQTRKLFIKALALIEDQMGVVIKQSGLYVSAPWGFEAQTDFLNMVAEVETRLSPEQQLEVLLHIEKELGRKRKSHGGYESRGIDLDILFIDNLVIDQPQLTVPHPRLHLRRFTLVPLCEKWNYWIHPVLNQSMASLLASCPDQGSVGLARQSLEP
jgi:2-amino-4-hydroxy-6-hydroxymethyldihydropteridine diphosphokinase